MRVLVFCAEDGIVLGIRLVMQMKIALGENLGDASIR